ncbi:hypothetical protein HFP72_26995 [Nocardiopsis sp. ARC36]
MSNLLEIWGDTVDSRHTLGAIALGVGIATPSTWSPTSSSPAAPATTPCPGPTPCSWAWPAA